MAIINGTAEGDLLVSLNDDDQVFGLDGNDELAAAHNNVILDGGSGVDSLSSSGNNNTLLGGLGEDTLRSLVGADNTTMDGGPDFDILVGGVGTTTASYASAPGPDGVTVDLSAGFASNDGHGTFDLLIEIQNVTGSAFDDNLTGDDFANVLQGGAGNDTLTGNGGEDVFKYSFDLTQGGGDTFSFTQFFDDHGGTVVGGEVADGTSQGQFSSLYTQWLESLGLTVLDLGQNSGPDGMPVVHGPDGTFGGRESFIWTSGSAKNPVVHERWYSDTWSTGDGQDAVTSDDGFDTIVDFTWGEDNLNFSGITEQQFLDFFNVDFSQDVVGDSRLDTVITIDGLDDWSVTLSGVSGHELLDFSNDAVFS